MNLLFLNHFTQQRAVGVILIILGVLVRYAVARRRFYRRGVAGLQHYPNFLTALFTTVIEWLLVWLSYGLILLGVVWNIPKNNPPMHRTGQPIFYHAKK